MEVNVNVNTRPLKILKRPLVTLLQIFIADHHLWPVLVSLFLGSDDFLDCTKGSVVHLCWAHAAVSLCCMQITNSNQCGNHGNQYPDCNYWKYCSFVRFGAFSDRDIQNHWSVTRYHLEVLCCIREGSSLIQGLHGHLLKTITSKEDRSLPCIMRQKSFFSAFRIRVELIRWTACRVFVRMVQRCLAAVGYRPGHPVQCHTPLPPLPHDGTQAPELEQSAMVS